MKTLICFVLSLILFFNAEGRQGENMFLSLNHSKVRQVNNGVLVSYVKFSNSVNGTFTSPATQSTIDSLFMKMDVTPLGTVHFDYWVDVNSNFVIDGPDINIGNDAFTDNNPNDLDPTQGIIITNIGGNQNPAMQVIVRAAENGDTITGVISMYNLQADFTLSGKVYISPGNPLGGALVFIGNGLGVVSNQIGEYSLPVNAGQYYVHIEDFGGRYSSFDTSVIITGNTIQDYYLPQLTSYIKGTVRDENMNPIANVEVHRDNGGGNGVMTDVNGHYKLPVPGGQGYFSLNSDDVLPGHIVPQSHQYSIAENDSIVNTLLSNFICYTVNGYITGTVRENGGQPTQTYLVVGYTNQYNSMTQGQTNSFGNFTLPVHNDITNPSYNVWVNTDNNEFSLPPGMYCDTSYYEVFPDGVVNFNILPALTSFSDSFSVPWQEQVNWGPFQYGNPFGQNSVLDVTNGRLEIQSSSTGGPSRYGVRSHKPFSINGRDYHFTIDNSQVLHENYVSILFSDDKFDNMQFADVNNWLQLTWHDYATSHQGWELTQSSQRNITTLWQTQQITGNDINFQFSENGTLTLLIDGVVMYQGEWVNNLPLAYIYLTEVNTFSNLPTPVFFDNVIVKQIEVGVREVRGKIPTEYYLEQNFPNPFNPSTNFKFQVKENGFVTLKIFDMLGKEVTAVVNEELPPGVYNATWNAANIPSGMYFYRLQVSGKEMQLFSQTKKMVLLK